MEFRFGLTSFINNNNYKLNKQSKKINFFQQNIVLNLQNKCKKVVNLQLTKIEIILYNPASKTMLIGYSNKASNERGGCYGIKKNEP